MVTTVGPVACEPTVHAHEVARCGWPGCRWPAAARYTRRRASTLRCSRHDRDVARREAARLGWHREALA